MAYSEMDYMNIGGGYDNDVIGVEQQIGIITINGTTYTKYRKIVDFGALPDTGVKNVAHGIDFTQYKCISLYGAATDNNGTVLPLPNLYYQNSTTQIYNINLYLYGGNVRIETFTDRSTFVGFVVIEYYK